MPLRAHLAGLLRRPVLKAAIALLRRADLQDVQRLGWHFQRRDFYSPLNDLAFLDANRDLWTSVEDPPGIDWAPERQLAVAREACAFVEELRDVPREPQAPVAYAWDNSFWNNFDAVAQYGLVRSRKPRRYVEVGCGWSSLLLARALARNRAEGAPATEVALVEPYPNELIFERLPGDWARHPVMLQRAPLELFDRLEAGDVLFYDGSHCARVASDVNWFFFRVLPRLRPGVLVHLHDIFLPHDYPEEWIFRRGQTWNEQYVLQAFLMHNPEWRIELGCRWLMTHHRSELEGLLKGVQPPLGVSFWMRRGTSSP